MPEIAEYRKPPVVLLTFANDRYEPRLGYLRDLVAEQQAIGNILTLDGEARGYRVIVEQTLTRRQLRALVRRHRDAVIGFHFGGHAGSMGLNLVNVGGRPDGIDAEALAAELSSLPRLRWVCLNGCSTSTHAQVLHRSSTAPVIATTSSVPDALARDFATHFYERLVDGASIADAFGIACSATDEREAAGVTPPAGSERMLRPAEGSPDGASRWTLKPHPEGLASLMWTLPAELAAHGLAGRLAVSRPREPRADAVSSLLVARHQVVPFTGRTDELRAIQQWADDPEPVRVRLIFGTGGSGKTRLLLEWLARQPDEHPVGFLGESIDRETVRVFAETERATVVIDYAETRAGLAPLIECLARRWAEQRPGRIRVVLLARNAGDWWTSLKQRHADAEGLLLDSPAPFELTALTCPDQRPNEFRRAAAAFAAVRGCAPPTAVPALDDDRFGRVLYLHMAALAAIDDLSLTASELVDGLVAHEQRMWIERARIARDDDDAIDVFAPRARAFLAAVTLRGGVGDRRIAEALAGRFGPEAPALVRFMRTIYGSDDAWVGPLEPDLLGATLVGGLLDDGHWPDWLIRSTEGAPRATLVHAFTVLGRIEADKPDRVRRGFADLLAVDVRGRAPAVVSAVLALGTKTAHSALGRVLAEALDGMESRTLATAIADRLPGRTTMLREVAVWASRQLIENDDPFERAIAQGEFASRLLAIGRAHEAVELTRRAVDTLCGLAPDRRRARSALISARLRLGASLHAAGRWEEAADATREAIDDIESRADAMGRTRRRQLAILLNNLGVQLGDLGRLDDARAVSERAVAIWRRELTSDPKRVRPYLASALHTCGNRLSAVGRRAAALEAIDEATTLYEALAAERPDAIVPRFATCLRNLGVVLADGGRHAEAVAAAERAVAVTGRLAAEQPDAFGPSHAMSLNNLGNRLASAGRNEEALEIAETAVSAYRRLVERAPGALDDGLALALSNLSNRLADVGRYHESLGAARKGEALYRSLARQRPERYGRALASSLDRIAGRLMILGKLNEALRVGRQALAMHRDLTERDRAGPRPELLLALNNQAGRCAAVGFDTEALAQAEEALAIGRELAKAEREAHEPALAMCLDGLALRLSAVGLVHESLAATDEAITLYRALAHEGPDVFRRRLQRALINRHGALSRLQRYPAALLTAREAVALARETVSTQDNPATRCDLALALKRFGRAHADVGEMDVALPPTEEAVAIWRELAAAWPNVHGPDLTHALIGLARLLLRVGRQDEAAAVSQEAVAYAWKLADAGAPVLRRYVADALHGMASVLFESGRARDAIAPLDEAVGLWSRLARAFPDRYRASELSSLGLLWRLQAEVGRAKPARHTRRKMLAIQRRLMKSRSPRAWTQLACGFEALLDKRIEMGQVDGLLESTERTIDLLRRLERRAPRAWQPRLATRLLHLGRLLADGGQRKRALKVVSEAVTLYRRLARQRPRAFRRALAEALFQQHTHLLAARKHPQAVRAVRETIGIHRELVGGAAGSSRGLLVRRLGTLCDLLSLAGRHEQALAIAQEAASRCRAQVDVRSARSLRELATRLDVVRRELTALGREEEALAAADHAVMWYRELAARHPESYLRRLARRVDQFSRLQAVWGTPRAALAAADEALRIRRTLEASRPRAFTHQVANSLEARAFALFVGGQLPAAIDVYQDALALRRLHADAHPRRSSLRRLLVSRLQALSFWQLACGRLDHAIASADEATKIAKGLLDSDAEDWRHQLLLALGLANRGILLLFDHRPTDAETDATALRPIVRRLLSADVRWGPLGVLQLRLLEGLSDEWNAGGAAPPAELDRVRSELREAIAHSPRRSMQVVSSVLQRLAMASASQGAQDAQGAQASLVDTWLERLSVGSTAPSLALTSPD